MTTNTHSFFTEYAIFHLMDYQIQKINRQLQDFMNISQEINDHPFDTCSKCGKKHPRLVKAGFFAI